MLELLKWEKLQKVKSTGNVFLDFQKSSSKNTLKVKRRIKGKRGNVGIWFSQSLPDLGGTRDASPPFSKIIFSMQFLAKIWPIK